MSDKILKSIASWVEQTTGRDVDDVDVTPHRKTALCWDSDRRLVKAVDIRSFTEAFVTKEWLEDESNMGGS